MNTELLFEKPIILEDELVRLEPLSAAHFELLLPTAMHIALWEFTLVKIRTPEDFRKYFDTALLEQQQQRSYPFSIYNKQLNQYMGCTRFGNIDLQHKKLEIGWTWLDRSQHGTGLNTTIKYLMLRHAFENWSMVRVQLKTAASNLRAQRAIEKLGAQREGLLRNHRRLADGRLDDTVLYSITDHDWPALKQQLEARFGG